MNFSLQYAQTMMNEQKWAEAIEIYRDIMKSSGYPVNIYKNIGLCMKHIGNADLAIKFLKRFEEISPDKEDVYIYLADITYSDIKDNTKAIEYYEKALLKVLKEVMDDSEDEYSLIDWWLFEDGREVFDKEDKKIYLETPEQLYDFMVSLNKEKEGKEENEN